MMSSSILRFRISHLQDREALYETHVLHVLLLQPPTGAGKRSNWLRHIRRCCRRSRSTLVRSKNPASAPDKPDQELCPAGVTSSTTGSRMIRALPKSVSRTTSTLLSFCNHGLLNPTLCCQAAAICC